MFENKSTFVLFLLAMVATLLSGSGCSNSLSMPRDRLGELPFPGLLTLYSSTNPDKLGTHRYERTPRLLGDESEGIIYTARAGFVDVAHIRITADTVRFCADRIRTAMRKREPVVALPTLEGSIFYVTLQYPASGLDDSGKAAATPEDERIADELAIRIGQRVTFLMMTWHEVLTWYGYRTIGLIDEQPSAFTWDDTMAHVVGLRVAGRVLRDTSGRSYDDRVTTALHDELKDLGAKSTSQTDRAAYAVKGIWWYDGKPLKRQVDVGLSDNVVRPWLIPGFSNAAPKRFSCRRSTTCLGVILPAFIRCRSIRAFTWLKTCERFCRVIPNYSTAIEIFPG